MWPGERCRATLPCGSESVVSSKGKGQLPLLQIATLRNRLEVEARVEIFASWRKIFDAGVGHKEVRGLLQPVRDCAVGIEPLPVARGEHLLRLERLVDIGERRLAVVSLLQRFHGLITVRDN